MGLQSIQILGPILDGAMRNTPEGRQFVRDAMAQGVKAAVIKRDGPFGDDSQGLQEEQPRRKSQLSPQAGTCGFERASFSLSRLYSTRAPSARAARSGLGSTGTPLS